MFVLSELYVYPKTNQRVKQQLVFQDILKGWDHDIISHVPHEDILFYTVNNNTCLFK